VENCCEELRAEIARLDANILKVEGDTAVLFATVGALADATAEIGRQVHGLSESVGELQARTKAAGEILSS
jgi:hypothetical protein